MKRMITLLVAITATAMANSQESLVPPNEADPLDQLVTVDTSGPHEPTISLIGVLSNLKLKQPINFLIRDDILGDGPSQQLEYSINKVKLGDLMDALALANADHWMKVGTVYVLMKGPGMGIGPSSRALTEPRSAGGFDGGFRPQDIPATPLKRGAGGSNSDSGNAVPSAVDTVGKATSTDSNPRPYEGQVSPGANTPVSTDLKFRILSDREAYSYPIVAGVGRTIIRAAPDVKLIDLRPPAFSKLLSTLPPDSMAEILIEKSKPVPAIPSTKSQLLASLSDKQWNEMWSKGSVHLFDLSKAQRIQLLSLTGGKLTKAVTLTQDGRRLVVRP